MLHKRHNSVVTFFILLTLFGVSKPAKAFLLAQGDGAPTTFAAPDKLPQDAEINIAASNSTDGVSSSLQESFTAKYPQATVNINTQDSGAALNSLAAGQADLAAIGRSLTAEEKAKGFVSVPISREKIAIVVSPENSYDGNLTIDQFAKIFRGEITDWSEIGGVPGEIELVDLPDTNDTRQAFPNYPVFQSAEFSTGSNTIKLEEDSTEAMVAQLGANGISYAVAGDVIDRNDVKIVTMHQTQPDDPRYPFSQPFSLVYQDTPSEAAQAYLGFAGSEGTEEIVDSRVGSISPATVAAIVSEAGAVAGATDPNVADTSVADGEKTPKNLDELKADVDAVGEDIDPNTEREDFSLSGANADAVDEEVEGSENRAAESLEEVDADADESNSSVDLEEADNDTVADAKIDTEGSGGANLNVEDSGEVNPGFEDGGEVNPDLEGSGEVNPGFEDGGEVNPDLEGSGEVNPDLESGSEVNPDLEGSGEPLSTDDVDGEVAVPDEAVDGEIEISENRGGRWWLWLLPLLAIPILGAIFFGGRKRSDREPALDNVPDYNRPDGGPSASGGSEAVGVPPVGTANVSGNVGNVEDAVETSTGINSAGLASGTALASGAAAQAARRNRFEDDMDLNLNSNESETAAEIPSNPVAEFTGQETKLQVSNQSTKLQVDDDFDLDSEFTGQETKLQASDQSTNLQTDEDFDLNADSRINNGISTGAAALGGVTAATSDMFDRDGNREQLDSNIADVPTEQTTSDFTDSANTVGTDVVGAEFPGDYVLPEETRSFDADTTIDSGSVDSEEDFLDRRSVANPETDLDSDRISTSIDTPEVDLPDVDSSVNIDETGVNVDRSQTNFSNDIDLESDRGKNIADNRSNTGGTSIAGGAAAIGGAAAAWRMFDRDDEVDVDETVIVPDSSEQDTELNLGSRLDDVTVEAVDLESDLTTPEDRALDLDIDSSQLNEASTADTAAASEMFDRNDEVDVDETVIVPDSSEQDTELNLGSRLDDVTVEAVDLESDLTIPEDRTLDLDIDSSELNEASSADTAAASEMFDRNDEVDVDETVIVPNSSEQDTELNLGSRLDDVTVEAVDLESDLTTPEDRALDLDIDSSELDETSSAGGATIAGGAAALGGAAAAASRMFDRNSETTEDAVDENQNSDSELDLNTSGDLDTLENVIDLRQEDSGSETLDLDLFTDADSNREMTIPERADGEGTAAAADMFESDVDEVTNDVREFETFETSFDITENDTPVDFADDTVVEAETPENDNNLEDMTLENVDSSADLDLESMTLGEEDTTDVSLEEIRFDDATTNDLTLDGSDFEDRDTPVNADLEDISTNTNEADVQLDEITFEDATADSDDNMLGDLNLNPDVNDVGLDDLGFEESTQTDTDLNPADIDLSSNRLADIGNLAEDPASDMSNISEWLDSLETPTQDSDSINDWLDTLGKDGGSEETITDTDTNNIRDNRDNQADSNVEAEADDISFQFLEDLLDREEEDNSSDR